jgi:hypothetical protein
MMMYIPGTIIYFTPFYFSDGTSRNKYFVVLAVVGSSLLIASLPTSKDHIPRSIQKKHGCIDDDKTMINCYFFEAGVIISECGTFSFPRNTYIYGEQISFIDKNMMMSCYGKEGTDYIVSCKLSDVEFQSIKQCLKKSGVVKKKFREYL